MSSTEKDNNLQLRIERDQATSSFTSTLEYFEDQLSEIEDSEVRGGPISVAGLCLMGGILLLAQHTYQAVANGASWEFEGRLAWCVLLLAFSFAVLLMDARYKRRVNRLKSKISIQLEAIKTARLHS